MFYDERVVIVAEQRPDASEEDSFQWMSRVLQVNMEPFMQIILLFTTYYYYQQCCLVSSIGHRQHPSGGTLLSGSGPGQHLT